MAAQTKVVKANKACSYPESSPGIVSALHINIPRPKLTRAKHTRMVITDEMKTRLLSLIHEHEISIRSASKMLGLNYSSCKHIISAYRKAHNLPLIGCNPFDMKVTRDRKATTEDQFQTTTKLLA